MELIDKDAVVAEIKKLHGNPFYRMAIKDVLSILDTLEVREVDIDKEIELVKGDYEQVDVAWNNDFDYIARHFFELGLKTQKL